MKIIAFSFSDRGRLLGDRLSKSNHYNITHKNSRDMNNSVKDIMEDIWNKYDGIIFIGATGIAVRYIAPYIQDKTIDPAIIVIDDMGKNIIALLSGHLGGANKIAKDIAIEIDGNPIITTASESRGIQSIDMFAKENDYYMEGLSSITKLTGMMVDGKKIGFYSEDNKTIDYPNLVKIENLSDLDRYNISGIIIITSKLIDIKKLSIDSAILRPKNINLGIGCRRNVDKTRIIDAIKKQMWIEKLSIKSLKSLATVEIKKDEIGIIEAAKYFNIPMKIFNIEDIEKVQDKFNKSEFVKETIGVYSVAEPCAYLLGGDFVSMRTSHNGITLSITKEEK